MARRHDCVVVLTRSPGDFAAAGAVLMEVYGGTGLPAEKSLAGRVAIGRERTIDQDPAFGLRIVVDIAIRALSPAVNDPTTAVQMIDQVEAFLRGIASRPRAGAWDLVDDRGVTRVVAPARRFETYLRLGVTEIVAYGARRRADRPPAGGVVRLAGGGRRDRGPPGARRRRVAVRRGGGGGVP